MRMLSLPRQRCFSTCDFSCKHACAVPAPYLDSSRNAQGGIDEDEHEVLYVGCLSAEVDPQEHEVCSLILVIQHIMRPAIYLKVYNISLIPCIHADGGFGAIQHVQLLSSVLGA